MNWWKKGAWKDESVSVQAVGWMAEKMWFDWWQGPEIFSSSNPKVSGVCVCVIVYVSLSPPWVTWSKWRKY
jgi:hypothetical protein